MSLQNLDDIPQDAKKFFNYTYVGPTAAKNSHGHVYHFNTTHADLLPTATFKMGGYFCAYCGESAYPIQANLRVHDDYDTTGYTCVCEDALADADHQRAVKELKKKHHEEMYQLNCNAPKAKPEARVKRFDTLVAEARKHADAKDWWRHGIVIDYIKESD